MIKKLLLTIFLLISLSLLLFLNAGRLLSVADENPPRRSDLIVVLGGDNGSRLPRGLDLYRAGRAPHLLVINPDEAVPRSLAQAGIAATAIRYEQRSRSSHDEAVNTLGLMQRSGWQRAVVVSDPPHLRRVQLAWGRVFRDSGCSFTLAATRPAWWDARRWWGNKQSRDFTLSELGKLVYYWIRY